MREKLEDDCVVVKQLNKVEAKHIRLEWLSRFSSEVFEKTGKWKIGGYLWEGFALNVQTSWKNRAAYECYAKQELEEFYIFDETSKYTFHCSAKFYPDYNYLGMDLYILPLSKLWTMVFTHERESFFSENTRLDSEIDYYRLLLDN